MLSSTTGEFEDLFRVIYLFGRPLQARGMADGLSTSPLDSKGSWSRVCISTMLFELKKEEASSLICIPHWTYGCLTSRQSSYVIQLFDVPLEGIARFTFLCKFDCLRCFNIACRHSTVDQYGAPTRLRHCQPSSHGGAVLRGTNAALTSPTVIARGRGTGHQRGFDIACRHRTVTRYYEAPTRLRHRPPSSHGGAVLRGTTRLRHRPPSSHGGAVRGTNAA